jgi:hypothetical protein
MQGFFCVGGGGVGQMESSKTLLDKDLSSLEADAETFEDAVACDKIIWTRGQV